MIMLQKQPSFLPQSPAMFHRRNPSAPPAVVVVQPTRTPGLLSLAKPRSNRQQRPLSKPVIPKQQVTAPPTPTPAPKAKQAKDRRHPEGPTTPNSNSDPFLLSQPYPTSPTLSTRPTGKLARRRQQQKQQQPTPPKVNPKPVSIATSAPAPLSLSASLPRRRPNKQRPIPDFPICDDMTEIGDDISDSSPPHTPTRLNPPPSYTRGASAPASTAFSAVTAGNSPKSVPATRTHRRAPSEGGVFHMSSDEGSAGEESFSSFTRSLDTKAFLDSLARGTGSYRERSAQKTKVSSNSGLLSTSAPYLSTLAFSMRTPVSSAERERMLEAQAQAQVQAGYFASSSFQNSPSPEDLPDPLLI